MGSNRIKSRPTDRPLNRIVMTQSRRIEFAAWSVLLLVALMVLYSPSFGGPYIFDDLNNVEANKSLESFPPKLNWRRPEARAVVLLTFSLERTIWGNSPFGHRMGNVIIHWMAATLLAGLIYLLGARQLNRSTPNADHPAPPDRDSKLDKDSDAERAGIPANLQPTRTSLLGFSLFSATLWAIHPLNTQAVAYIVQRFESMMGMFFFAFLLSIALQDRARSRQGRVGWIVAALVFFVLGLWSKTIMITAIAVGPLMDRAWLCSSWREVFSRRGWLYLPPVVLGALAAVSLAPALIRGDANVGFGGDTIPVDLYLAAQAQVIPGYMTQLFFPAELSLDHGLLAPESVSRQAGWLALMLFFIGLGIWLQIAGHVRAAFFVLAPLLVLSPSSSFVPTLDLMVEHRMYVPSALIITGMVWAVANVCRRFAARNRWNSSSTKFRTAVGFTMILLASLYAFRTYVRASDYGSGIGIWQQAIIHNPSNPRAAQNMIDEAHSAGVRDVISLFKVPVRLAAESGKWSGILKGRVAEELIKIGEPNMAIPILTSAVTDSAETDRLLKRRFLRFDVRQELASHRVNLAIALSQLGRPEAALVSLDEAFSIDDRQALSGELVDQGEDLQRATVASPIEDDRPMPVRSPVNFQPPRGWESGRWQSNIIVELWNCGRIGMK